jgi:MFS transporter, Spinster family, sphingosine-1-phosphate transporter
MAPFAAIALLIRNPNDIAREDHDDGESSVNASKTGFLKGVRIILRLPALVLTMLALVCLNGSLGGFSFFGSKAAKHIFNLKSSDADLLFGVSTVVTGIVGTLSGGILLDFMGSNVKSALLLCIVGVGTAASGLAISFAATSKLWTFSPGFLLGETAMFITSAPAIAVMLWTSPANLRPTALALSEILNHVFGDIPLPVLLGVLQEKLDNWRLTMCMCTAMLAISAVMFSIARCTVTKELLEQQEEVIIVVGSNGDGRSNREDGGDIESEGLEEPLLVSRE